MPNHVKSKIGLNELPIDWERHPDRDKWAVLKAPDGRKITYHMSARSYRFDGENKTMSAAPELMYKRIFLNESPTPVPFGRHEWHSVEWIVREDPDYADWLMEVAEEWLRQALEEEFENVQGELGEESNAAGVSN
ncbi:hypothetical protein [Salinibacter ruber]|uniref:hypothetical protein n=1 Tax=Salinibacter ruber TaxID=146919 RepID=UPI000E56C151|nr:hypothetical protein [Salinibacter ruber]